MIGKEVIIWLDRRWYDALNEHLKGETLEEHLEDVIDQLCNRLPEHEYKRISQEIWQEEQANKRAQEAARRFAVFHVTEDGSSTYFVAEENLEMLQAVCDISPVPVIASGGAGCIDHFTELFKTIPQVDAGLAASIFHFGEVKISDLKDELKRQGINVR